MNSVASGDGKPSSVIWHRKLCSGKSVNDAQSIFKGRTMSVNANFWNGKLFSTDGSDYQEFRVDCSNWHMNGVETQYLIVHGKDITMFFDFEAAQQLANALNAAIKQ